MYIIVQDDGPTKVCIFLGSLNFGVKQAIVRDVINKVIATPRELLVSGYISIEKDFNYEFKTIHRYRGAS